MEPSAVVYSAPEVVKSVISRKSGKATLAVFL